MLSTCGACVSEPLKDSCNSLTCHCRCTRCGDLHHDLRSKSLCNISAMVSMLKRIEGFRGRGGLIPLDQRVLSASVSCRAARSHVVPRAGASSPASRRVEDPNVRCATARLRASSLEVSAKCSADSQCRPWKPRVGNYQQGILCRRMQFPTKKKAH